MPFRPFTVAIASLAFASTASAQFNPNFWAPLDGRQDWIDDKNWSLGFIPDPTTWVSIGMSPPPKIEGAPPAAASESTASR